MKILIVLQIICTLVSGFSQIRNILDEFNVIAEDVTNTINDIEDSVTSLIKTLETKYEHYKNEFFHVLDDFGTRITFQIDLTNLNYFNFKSDMNKQVTFTLFNKRGGNRYFDTLKVDDENLLQESRFDKNKPTVFITHGYMTSAKGPSVTLVRDAFLMKRDFNVITVNWNSLSKGSYVIARIMVIRVGNHIGKMINFLYNHGMHPMKTVLVGHSLGAHVMGLAGQTAKYRVHHIIGLDPAWPLFYTSSKFADHRISADDAQHVEIIHTNGGRLGSSKTWGDYDFYPNGGSRQNGCEKWFTTCSHSRAYEYLAEQIKEIGFNFVAVKCDSYKNFQNGECASNKAIAIMGSLDKTGVKRGSYYLDTNTKTPFALGAPRWAKISKIFWK